MQIDRMNALLVLSLKACKKIELYPIPLHVHLYFHIRHNFESNYSY